MERDETYSITDVLIAVNNSKMKEDHMRLKRVYGMTMCGKDKRYKI
ncbi:MAG: hypothetical protein WC757_03200 [Candidatus Paceibacterota bacterium]|jgi:hypothetical protein